MAAHKRTEITIETKQVFVMRRHRSLRVWCPDCGCDADMVSQAEAQALTGLTQLPLRDGAQNGRWHVSESQGGEPLVCLDSLLESLQRPKLE
ncbi:MAG TPA: hypothetical protein VI386_10820 [Candidatus Sulfotelmatobacter sp.]